MADKDLAERLYLMHACPEAVEWARGYTDDAEAGMVTLDYFDDGVDCDGRLTRSGILECPADRLASFLPCYEGAMPRPEWQEKQARQRDYAAEAAGY